MMEQGVALLVTSHFYQQGRRGSMHWLADELAMRGWQVRFLTFGFSTLSRLVGDVRLKSLKEAPLEGSYPIKPGIEQIFHSTVFHPIDLRSKITNCLARPLFGLFPTLWGPHLKQATEGADLIVLESGLPLMLAPMLSRMSSAKLVYRVNDDIRVMRAPPMLRPLEMRYATLFDRISVASPILARRFEFTGKVGLDPMGLDTDVFAKRKPDPFGVRWEREVVSSGTSHFDADATLALASLRPDWRFHIIGRLRQPVEAPNIVLHGELAFDDVIPFVQHADIGLAPYRDLPGVEYQTHHSNRIIQYAFCRLPTLVPSRMEHPSVPHLIGYDGRSHQSMESALDRAGAFDRAQLDGVVNSWADLSDGILKVFE